MDNKTVDISNTFHYVAVIGGSISGSEAAHILAENGIRVVVFEMNNLPYGKIEDGLPCWHINLRNRQIKEINKKLNHKNIRYVPNTKIGEDIQFNDLVLNWGFTSIILANGAWSDRELPIKGINQFVDKELIYQNSFINWFNHKHESNYNGKNYFVKNGAVVIGGGLASLDVVKIVMIELLKKQLFIKKNIRENIFDIEKYGVAEILKKHQLTLNDLDIQKARLVYRRTARQMPLKLPKDDRLESIKKAQETTQKLLNKYQQKYLFDFIPQSIPIGYISNDGKLTGLTLQKVYFEDGEMKEIENGKFELKTDFIISSIGSIPEKIEGLNYVGNTLKMKKQLAYSVSGYDHVFAVGNAVTGKGNIQESKKHGKEITNQIIKKHLTKDALEKWLNNINGAIISKVNKQVNEIITDINSQPLKPDYLIENILNKTREIQKKVHYESFESWITKHLPSRLENQVFKNTRQK